MKPPTKADHAELNRKMDALRLRLGGDEVQPTQNKDGREWVRLEVEAQDVEGSGSIPTPAAIVAFARARGFDAKRWGECVNDGWIWIQGPRL